VKIETIIDKQNKIMFKPILVKIKMKKYCKKK